MFIFNFIIVYSIQNILKSLRQILWLICWSSNFLKMKTLKILFYRNHIGKKSLVTFLRDNIFTWFQFSGSSTWLAAVPSCLIVVTVTRLHIPTKLFIGTFYMVKTKIFRPSFCYTSIKIKQKTRPETHWLFCLPVHYIFSKYIYLYLFPRLFFLKTHCFEECNHCSI